MTKFLLLLVTYLCSLQLFAYSIIPNKTDQSLFYLYKLFTIDQVTNTVKVNGIKVLSVTPGVNLDTANISATGNTQTITLQKFMFFRKFSPSVFATVTGMATGVGTSFLVADNLILTNKHVADTDNKKKDCGKISIMINGPEAESVTCKKVWYCDQEDFCLIEMNTTKAGKNLGQFLKPLIFSNKNVSDLNSTVNSIGNVRGLGIQGGTAHGIKYVGAILEHNAPTLKGSSGSPILNKNGIILGINYAESGSEYGDTGNNYAVSSSHILSQLKAKLPAAIYAQIKTEDPATLSEGDPAFEKLWLTSWTKFANLNLYTEKDITKCLIDNLLAECSKQLKKTVEDAKVQMTGLGSSEQNLILVKANGQLKVIEEIEKIIAMKGSYELAPHQISCQLDQDMSFDCVKDEYITTVLFKNMLLGKWLMTLESSPRELLIHSIVNRSLLTDSFYRHEVLRKLEADKKLVSKVFFNCLAAVKTITSTEEGWLGDSSDIGYDDDCEATIVSTVKNHGYRLDTYSDQELISSMRMAMHNFKFSDNFKKSVVMKWQYFLKHLLLNKDERKENNQELIKQWLETEKITEVSAEKIFIMIQKKMRLI